MKIFASESKSLELERTQTVSIKCRDLEQTIHERVQDNAVHTETEAKAEESPDPVPVDMEICSRHDCYLLDCRRPLIPVTSILGVIEELLQEDESLDSVNPTLFVEQYEIKEVSDASQEDQELQSNFIPDPPHSAWTRTPRSFGQNTSQSGASQQGVLQANRNQVMWCDFRQTSIALEIETPGQCCHFLRSLLSVSHAGLPWRPAEHSDSECPLYDMVLILLPTTSECLRSFRTSDACPSFFLHSLCRLCLPASATWWNDPNGSTAGEFSPATLYVYRKLPPRDSLTSEHPRGSILTTAGCLWETFYRQPNEEDDSDEVQEVIRAVAPPYIDYLQDYPATLLQSLLENIHVIREEALSIPQWTAWPEKNHYSANPDDPDAATWTVFPLCHCFPANMPEKKQWIQTTCSHVPKTAQLLDGLGQFLRTALFSRLNPETKLEAHTGWEDLANHVYRMHIPLKVPSPGGLCGTWVDGAVETHEEGRPLVFDDSKVHRAFNYSREERIVLIIDLARPVDLPLGTASGGHSSELDDFINTVT